MTESPQINVNEIQFAQWQAPHFRPINKFYKSQKHKGKANGNDLVFYAYRMVDQEQDVLGAVRLVPAESSEDLKAESNYLWLRSLYIHEALRGKHIGSMLLKCVNDALTDVPIYCFPYDHLENFYCKAGYRLMEHDSLPSALQDLFERYTHRGEKILVMGKEPS